MSFGVRLRVARKDKYASAMDFKNEVNKELAVVREKLHKDPDDNEYKDLAYTTYIAYEIGNREPRYALLVRMAKLLDVSTDYLLGVEDERGKFTDMVWEDFLQCRGDIKDSWETPKNIYLIMKDNGMLTLKKNVCYKIMTEMMMRPEEEILAKLNEQVDAAREKQLMGKASQLAQCLARLAAADLGVDYPAFGRGFTKLLWSREPLCLTNLDGLCFYYFTGINPAAGVMEEGQAINIWLGYQNRRPVTRDRNKKIRLETVQAELKRIMHQYEPVKRLAYLEEYVALRSGLDYDKYVAKYAEKIEGFRNLQHLFLDSMCTDAEQPLRTLGSCSAQYIDVAAKGREEYFKDLYTTFEQWQETDLKMAAEAGAVQPESDDETEGEAEMALAKDKAKRHRDMNKWPVKHISSLDSLKFKEKAEG